MSPVRTVEPAGHPHEQLVTGRVAKLSLISLKSSRSRNNTARRDAGRLAPGRAPTGHGTGTVRQAAQGIVERLVLELLFEPLAFGYVTYVSTFFSI